MGAAQGARAIRVVIPTDTGQILAATPQGHHHTPGLWEPAGNRPHLLTEGGAVTHPIAGLDPVQPFHQATPRAARAIATPSG